MGMQPKYARVRSWSFRKASATSAGNAATTQSPECGRSTMRLCAFCSIPGTTKTNTTPKFLRASPVSCAGEMRTLGGTTQPTVRSSRRAFCRRANCALPLPAENRESHAPALKPVSGLSKSAFMKPSITDQIVSRIRMNECR